MKHLSVLFFLTLAVGCGAPASDDGAKAGSGGDKPQSGARDPSTDDEGSNGEVARDGGRSPSKPATDGTTPPMSGTGGKDGSATPTPTTGKDAGAGPATPRDGGVAPSPTPDGGGTAAPVGTDGGGAVTGSGSCCAEHDTGGCGNADLMVCVCEKDPSCCTKAWGKHCVFIVEQKYCQAGVRDCVCGSAEGQWGQAACCASEWSSTCDSVAKLKCDAVPGCF